jgi:hypothetical protein
MFQQSDLLMRDTIDDGFAALRKDPTPLADLFAMRPMAEQQEIAVYFQNNVIPVQLGYARQNPQPGVYVILGSSAEDQQKWVLGSTFPADGYPPNADAEGSFFRTTLNLVVWDVNADRAVWMSSIVRYILLANRINLETDGLFEQAMTAQDLVPVPVWLPDYAFARNLALTFYESDVVVTPDEAPIQNTITPVPIVQTNSNYGSGIVIKAN